MDPNGPPLPPLPPLPLTVLQGGDVQWLAAVVSRPDTCVSLHHDAVACILPQMHDVDVVYWGGEIHVVSGIPKFQAVVSNHAVRQQRRLPGHIHLAGTERLKTKAIWRTAWSWRENTRGCSYCSQTLSYL